jgi:hypothetical protein
MAVGMNKDDARTSAGRGRPSPFRGHYRRGRRHVPPLLNLPVEPTLRPFRKVAFPDFLWLLTMLRLRPLADGGGETARALDAGQSAFHRAFERGGLASEREPVFHGLLTDWEHIPDKERAEVLAEFERRGTYDAIAPESLAHVLAAYDDAPGRWLIQPRIDAGLVPELIKAEEHLWETMRLGADSHQDLATHAIYMWFRGMVRMQRISFDRDDPGFQALQRYEERPTDRERKLAETTLRASFLSIQAAGLSDNPPSAAWCERFWRTNGRLFRCVLRPREESEPANPDRLAQGSARMYQLHYRFLRASADIDPDVWDHDRYDVLTGVVWRILRTAAHLVAHPPLWSEEHGYPSIRMLFEAYVQLKWMLAVEASRPGVWHEFKNYGRGRTKALLLHTEEVISRSDGDSREILERLLPKLRAQANRDVGEDFQDISTASTFAADKTLLDMAREVSLEDMYHSVMIPASSALHGDWAALEDLVLDRCVHVLHDDHAIPRAEYAEESTEQLPYLAESFASWTFAEYCRAMAYSPISSQEAEAEMLGKIGEAESEGAEEGREPS